MIEVDDIVFVSYGKKLNFIGIVNGIVTHKNSTIRYIKINNDFYSEFICLKLWDSKNNKVIDISL